MFAIGFAIFGLMQLIKRKSLKKVDHSIIILGISYLLTAGSYVFFEFIIVNYRPIILGESLASSFPSSTTLTVVSIMGTSIMQFNYWFKSHKTIRLMSITIAGTILGITVTGRKIYGDHWFTDILGGLLLGAFIVILYYSFVNLISYKQNKKRSNKMNKSYYTK